METALYVGLACAVCGFIGGVFASGVVHEAEARLHEELLAVESRLTAALNSLKK